LRIFAGEDVADFDLAGLTRLLLRPFLRAQFRFARIRRDVAASDGLVDWLVSSAKAGELEMIMIPAAAKAVRENVMESPSVTPLP